jgi:hypothetical protein
VEYYLNYTDASKLGRIQWKFLALCYNRFFPHIHYSYANALEHLNFHTYPLGGTDALFIVDVYNGFKFCLLLLEIVGIRILTRNLRDFPLLTVGSLRKTGPSARCASAANTACKDIDKLIKHLVKLNNILM